MVSAKVIRLFHVCRADMALLAIISIMAAESSMATGFTFILSAKVVQGERKAKRIKEYLTFLNLSQPLAKPNERAFSPLLFFKQSYPVSETLQPFRTEFRQAALCLLDSFLLLGMGFGEELVGIANQLFFQGDGQEVLVG